MKSNMLKRIVTKGSRKLKISGRKINIKVWGLNIELNLGQVVVNVLIKSFMSCFVML